MAELVAGSWSGSRVRGSLLVALGALWLMGPRISQAAKRTPDETGSEFFKPRHYETLVAAGGAHAYESDIFNLSPDEGSHPGIFLDFRLRQLLNDSWAFGFHIFGTTEKTAQYLLFPPGVTSGVQARFDLTVIHTGLDARYRFSSGPIQPYLEAGLSYVGGGADNDTYGHLGMQGFSIGPGAGVVVPAGTHLLLGAELQYAYGRARWKDNPSVNSSSRAYDPSLLAVAGTLGWHWGH